MLATIKRALLALSLGLTIHMPAAAQDVLGSAGIKGAGSTFAYPILSKWSREYRAANARGGDFRVANTGLEDPAASTALEYEPVGSLAGILRIKDRAVDFGMSDMPLAAEELNRLDLTQFPIVIGGVVIAFNIAGIAAGELRLSGPVLADIFLGRIRNWSDPAIKALNPSLKLPDAPIAVIHRADGSGTTFNFTEYLAKVSPAWKDKVGSNLRVNWPVGTAARGNLGVSQAIRRTRNAIGYVEYAQAVEAKLAYAALLNRAGKYVLPDAKGLQAAAASADWPNADAFNLLLTDVAGDDAYPITATVFALLNKQAAARRSAAVLDFFQWSLDKGGILAVELGYVSLPIPVVKQIKRSWLEHFRFGA